MKSIRVLISTVGLDGHQRGAAIVARGLMEAGMEVIYLGIMRTPEEVVQTAIEEDVDVIGISSLSGGHMSIFPDVIELLKKQGRDKDIILIGGGVIPKDECETLRKMGVAELFVSGSRLSDIIHYIESRVSTK